MLPILACVLTPFNVQHARNIACVNSREEELYLYLRSCRSVFSRSQLLCSDTMFVSRKVASPRISPCNVDKTAHRQAARRVECRGNI